MRSSDEATDALVAEIYYNYGTFGWASRPTQQEIGRHLGLSRWQVLEALKRAEDKRLVQHIVKCEGRRDTVLEFQLLRVVNSGRPESAPRLSPEATRIVRPRFELQVAPGEEQGFLRREVGYMAAQLMEDLVGVMFPRQGSAILGLSCGRTIQAMVEAMRPIGIEALDLCVVPLVGWVGFPNDQGLESTNLVNKACVQLGCGTPHGLPAPAYVHSPSTQTELLNLPTFLEVGRLWRQADILVSGVGGMQTQSTALALYGLSQKNIRKLENDLRVAGDLSLHLLTRDGKPLYEHALGFSDETKEALRSLAYPVAAELEHFRQAASGKGRHAIAVGAGPSRAPAFVAAIRGGYVDGLVVDSDTARSMIDLWRAGA